MAAGGVAPRAPTAIGSRWIDAAPIGRVAGAVAVLALLTGVAMLFGTATIAHQVEALATSFDSDQSLSDENRQLIAQMIGRVGALALVVGIGLLAWSWAWVAASSRLAAHPGSPGYPATGLLPAPTAFDTLALGVGMTMLLMLALVEMNRGLGYDEIVTVQNFVRAPGWWGVVSRQIVFNNHIPYSLLARISEALLGRADWVYRVPALLLGLAALPTTWLLGRRLVGPAAARLAVLLLATAPLMVEYSASARGYTGLLLCGIASTLGLVRLIERGGARPALAYAVVSALGIWFHLYGVLVVGAHVAYVACLVWRAPHRVQRDAFKLMLLAWLAAGVLAVLLLSPSLARLWLELNRRRAGTFQPLLPWTIALDLSGQVWVAVVLVGIGIVHQVRQARPWIWLAVLLLVVPITVPWLMKPFDLYARFFIFLLPIWVLLMADGMVTVAALASRARARFRPAAHVLSLAMVVAVATVWALRVHDSVLHDGFKEGGAAMVAGADATVVFVGLGGAGALVSYYTDRPVQVPETVAEFEAGIAGAREVRVAVYNLSESARTSPILALLTPAATTVTHHHLTVYTWHPPAADVSQRQ